MCIPLWASCVFELHAHSLADLARYCLVSGLHVACIRSFGRTWAWNQPPLSSQAGHTAFFPCALLFAVRACCANALYTQVTSFPTLNCNLFNKKGTSVTGKFWIGCIQSVYVLRDPTSLLRNSSARWWQVINPYVATISSRARGVWVITITCACSWRGLSVGWINSGKVVSQQAFPLMAGTVPVLWSAKWAI